MASDHPHILKICTDQHSPLVAGFAGDPWVRTPNLDRLADRGTVFDNHYCASPLCVPGRYAMLTGLMPRDLGACFYEDDMPTGVPTYAGHLAAYGYQTTCVGKMHFHGQPQMHGWLFRPFGDMETCLRKHVHGWSEAGDRDRVILSELNTARRADGVLECVLMAKRGDHKRIRYPGGERELFNLAADPDEQRNLASDPQAAEHRRDLESALDDFERGGDAPPSARDALTIH